MYIWICIYAQVHIHIYIYMHIYIYICTYTYIYIHIYIYKHIYIHIYIYNMQTCIYTYTHTYIYMYVCLHIYTHIYIFHHIKMLSKHQLFVASSIQQHADETKNPQPCQWRETLRAHVSQMSVHEGSMCMHMYVRIYIHVYICTDKRVIIVECKLVNYWYFAQLLASPLLLPCALSLLSAPLRLHLFSVSLYSPRTLEVCACAHRYVRTRKHNYIYVYKHVYANVPTHTYVHPHTHQGHTNF